MTKYTLALLPLLMASTAIAGPATEEGAQHLTEVFQTYLGKTEGLVSVTANGDVYDLSFDPAPLMKAVPAQVGEITVSPFEMQLTDNGDGTWGVTQDQAFSMLTKMADGTETKADIARLTSEGTFDESLMMFSTQTSTLEGYVTTSTQVLPDNGGTISTTTKTEKSEASVTSTANAEGGVDTELKGSSTGMTGEFTFPAEAGAPAMPVTFSVASANYDAKMTGLRTEGILGVVAFFVAHPDEASIKGAKDEAKAAITAALPIVGNALVDGKATDVSVQTPMGPVTISEAGFTLDVNGAVADGKFREAFSLTGVTPPPGLVPEWAVPILPQKVSLDFQASGFDAAAGVTTALEGFDLPEGMADTTEFDAKVQKAFFPNGTVTVSINPSAITGQGYELTYQGDMTVDVVNETPSGKALITLKGADVLQGAINNAPDDMKMQAMMGFGMAQGMAKQEGDKLVWEIDATNPANVLINGTPLMGGQ